ncbi:hypothetical protein C1Y40_00123 [Mycobacterium talmoniae]|uniref:Uncharacterized protein n=1 Tax=Mycobacterium talmoniae TaxID=1858794 RepID=A0A2S8BSM5_9MYCO|nr:hypothetical protein C1Y40_00123 [Mycobacterium talmoniae]
MQRRGRCDPAHQVRRAADEVFRGAHIAPVAGVDVPAHGDPVRQQRREHLPFHRDGAPARDAVDDRAVEHVAAGVDLVGRRILGLLQKRGDPAVLGGHAAERPRVADPHQMQGQIGVVAVVVVEQLAQVGAGEHVAVEHHRGVVAQLVGDVGDAAAGAQRLGLGHVLDLQTQLGAVPEFGLEHPGLIRRAQHDVLDAGGGDPRQQVGDKRQPGGGQPTVAYPEHRRHRPVPARPAQPFGLGAQVRTRHLHKLAGVAVADPKRHSPELVDPHRAHRPTGRDAHHHVGHRRRRGGSGHKHLFCPAVSGPRGGALV